MSKTEVSFEFTNNVVSAPVGTNVKLWIYSPTEKSTIAGSPGVFYQKTGSDWKFLPANPDGSFYTNFSEGNYSIDVVEPNPTQFVRKRYTATVNASGVFSIRRMLPNSSGFFTVTVDLTVPVKSNSFVPTSQCQLRDQTNNPEMNVGFPKAPGRLPSFGTIRALIIPVDFADVVGKRPPSEEFTPMSDGTNDFFYKMSGNKVKFDFQVLQNWVRMPVSSSFHKLGTWSSGDVDGYWKMAVDTADPLVDYSQFDVIYVLSPREIPWSSMAYGPAGPLGETRMLTDDGAIRNITSSGADAWQNIGQGTPWKWMAHETGHLFGLHDLYVSPGEAVYGDWDLMSSNWSTSAIEINLWNRYLLGWVADSQVNCLTDVDLKTAGSEYLIDPIERVNALSKGIVVKLSDSKILVIESRRNEGFDNLPASQEGTLVYTVDMTIPTIKGGWQVQRRPGSVMKNFADAALQQGDVITVGGVRIEILKRTEAGDLVKVSKP